MRRTTRAVKVVGSPTMRSEAWVPSEQLQPDGPVLGSALPGDVERACERWSRVRRVVPGEEAHVRCPCGPFRVVRAGLQADEDRLALARKHADVVALHPPEVREVEDVVGRADDERVQPTFVHQHAHPVELGVVARPASSERNLLPYDLAVTRDDPADAGARVVPARHEDVTIDELGQQRPSRRGALRRIRVGDVEPVRLVQQSAGAPRRPR